MTPKTHPLPVSGICKHIILKGRRDFEVAIKLRTLRCGGYFGLSGGSCVIKISL